MVGKIRSACVGLAVLLVVTVATLRSLGVSTEPSRSHASSHRREAPMVSRPAYETGGVVATEQQPEQHPKQPGSASCAARLQTAEEFKCGYGSKADCSQQAAPLDVTRLCPHDKLQDAYHIEIDGTCTQVCLPPGLRKVAGNHGVHYGMRCYNETLRNKCTRFYLTGSRVGVHYWTFFCLEPCSAERQACDGPTNEYNIQNTNAGTANRGPSRPRWSGDWWEGVAEDELEKQGASCSARKAEAVAPATAVDAEPVPTSLPHPPLGAAAPSVDARDERRESRHENRHHESVPHNPIALATSGPFAGWPLAAAYALSGPPEDGRNGRHAERGQEGQQGDSVLRESSAGPSPGKSARSSRPGRHHGREKAQELSAHDRTRGTASKRRARRSA